MRLGRGLAVSLLVGIAVGCASYRTVQRNVFSDEDGFLVAVEYGIAEKDHVNTFVSPMTGKEMDFKSRLLIQFRLPNGETYKAWQCMNFQPRGTMYKTDDGEWQVLVNGFSCIVYRADEKNPDAFRTVYRGVLCETAAVDAEKDDRWKVVHPSNKPYKGTVR